MKRMGLVFWLLALFPPVLQAAPASVTAETLAGKSSSPGLGPDTYTLVLKQGGKTVVSRKDDTQGGRVPEVQTFPTKYCGVPAQVVVLWAECIFWTIVGTDSDASWAVILIDRGH